jgi:hypothetical protein
LFYTFGVNPWFVLGFTIDDVVGGGQDRRLAEEVGRAWQAAGGPALPQVVHGAGRPPHVSYWYVSPGTADVLDQLEVDWRRFVVGRAMPPADAPAAIAWDKP